MSHDPHNEFLPVVDEQGIVIGKCTRKECHSDHRIIHPVVHLHVFDGHGNLYLQKRAMTKDLLPGLWDSSVGGHIGFGESTESALARESLEELGFIPANPVFRFSYLWRNPTESEFVYSFTIVYNGKIVISPDEIDDGRFFGREEIEKRLGSGFFTPNFENEYSLLVSHGMLRSQ